MPSASRSASPTSKLKKLAHVSHALDELLNRAPNRHAPYVGESAFATKAGIHASAIVKDPATYEHVAPESVGNRRKLLVSDQAGRSNVLAELERIGLKVDKDDPRVARLLDEVKEREAIGYAYEAADASFELLARRMLGTVPNFFDVELLRRQGRAARQNAQRRARHRDHGGGEGQGRRRDADLGRRRQRPGQRARPRAAQGPRQVPEIHRGSEAHRLPRAYPQRRHRAVTRVLIESEDETGEHWTTVGVSANIIDASFQALMDSIVYKLVRAGAPA